MCKKMMVFILLLLMVFPVYTQGQEAKGEIPLVKVCIVQGTSQVKGDMPGSYVLLNEHSGSQIEGLEGEIVFEAREQGIKLKASDGSFKEVLTGPLRIKMKGNPSTLVKINGTRYRGDIIIAHQVSGDNNRLQVINQLDVESYLRGVVPREMPVSWHMEALKAQAVSARTYALRSMGRHGSEGYDLCCGQHCQVYGGADAEFDRTDEAVETTRGRVLTYQGQLAQTFYHATNGGHTEAPENVWANSLPYLKSLPDPYDDPHNQENMVHNRAIWGPVSFSGEDLESRLKSHGVDIGQVLDVKIKEKVSSGRVVNLEFVGVKGTFNALKEKARTIFSYTDEKGNNEPGLNSQMFELETDSRVWIQTAEGKKEVSRLEGNSVLTARGNHQLKDKDRDIIIKGSNGEIIRVPPVPTAFEIRGYGWGHGVGMSQNGAYNRALAGYTYREIMDFYYPGTRVESRY